MPYRRKNSDTDNYNNFEFLFLVFNLENIIKGEIELMPQFHGDWYSTTDKQIYELKSAQSISHFREVMKNHIADHINVINYGKLKMTLIFNWKKGINSNFIQCENNPFKKLSDHYDSAPYKRNDKSIITQIKSLKKLDKSIGINVDEIKSNYSELIYAGIEDHKIKQSKVRSIIEKHLGEITELRLEHIIQSIKTLMTSQFIMERAYNKISCEQEFFERYALNKNNLTKIFEREIYFEEAIKSFVKSHAFNDDLDIIDFRRLVIDIPFSDERENALKLFRNEKVDILAGKWMSNEMRAWREYLNENKLNKNRP